MKNKYLILTKVANNNVEDIITPGRLPIGSKMIQGYHKYDDIKIGFGLYLYPTLDLTSGPKVLTSEVISFNPETLILMTFNSTYSVEIYDN